MKQRIEPTTLGLVVVLVAVVGVAQYARAAELVVTGVSALAIVVAGLARSMVRKSESPAPKAEPKAEEAKGDAPGA